MYSSPHLRPGAAHVRRPSRLSLADRPQLENKIMSHGCWCGCLHGKLYTYFKTIEGVLVSGVVGVYTVNHTHIRIVGAIVGVYTVNHTLIKDSGCYCGCLHDKPYTY